MELRHAVRQVADCPCDQHQGELVAAVLATPEIIVRVVSTNTPAEGSRSVSASEQTTVETVVISDRTYLHGFSSLDAARELHPGATLAGIARDQAFRMACAENLSGLVVTADDATDAWAVITKSGLLGLLEG